MDFAIMVWSSDNVLSGSVFAVVNKTKPFKVPRLSGKGNWAYFGTVNEQGFRDSAAAKKSIEARGYYLT